MQKQGKGISDLLKVYGIGNNYQGKYYVAINFMLIDFKEQLNAKKAIPIVRTSVPLVSSGQYCPKGEPDRK